MSFLECLQEAVADKRLKPAQFEQAKARFENFLADNMRGGMDAPSAAAKAAEDAVRFFDIENKEAKRRKLAQLHANVKAWRDMRAYKGEKHQAWYGFFDLDDKAPFDSYASIKDAVEGTLHSYLASVLEKFKPRAAGAIRPTGGQETMLREIFGENTGDADARGLADAWRATNETAVKMFRAAGGSLAERADWHLPQKQDYAKLLGKRDEWVQQHLQWLDWEKVRTANGARIPVEERSTFLSKAYDTLVSDGASRTPLGQASAGSAIGNRLPLHRVLVYRNADAWIAMHSAYGSGSIYDVLVGHVSDMAHEIAMVKRFGPNPALTIRNMQNMIRKLAAEAGNVGLADAENAKLGKMFAIASRENGLSHMDGIGNFMAGVRNLLTSAFLGSASLVAVPSDLALATIAKNYNRLDGMRFMSRYLSLMNPTNGADRQLAVRLGLLAEHAVAQAYGARRLLGFDIAGPSITRRITDVTMNLSLLTPHTKMARWAFGMEFLGLLADNATKAFDELPFRDMLTRHGITADDWNAMRKTPLYEERGATFLRPLDYMDVDGSRAGMDLAQKFQTMVVDESKFAIPDVNMHSRRILIGDTDPGTFLGEVARSFAMFKNFPLTFTNVIMRRYLTDALVDGRQASYSAALLLSMSAIGALRIQLGQITQGRDPQKMDDPKFIMRALMTGGGLGIYGDFLLQDHNRFGDSLPETVAGPVFGQALPDALKLTAGNMQQLLDGDDPEILRELAEAAKRYTPGTSIWWGRLLMERLLWDELQRMADPKFVERVRRAEKRRQKEFGQGSWWQAGERKPDRAPRYTHRAPVNFD